MKPVTFAALCSHAPCTFACSLYDARHITHMECRICVPSIIHCCFKPCSFDRPKFGHLHTSRLNIYNIFCNNQYEILENCYTTIACILPPLPYEPLPLRKCPFLTTWTNMYIQARSPYIHTHPLRKTLQNKMVLIVYSLIGCCVTKPFEEQELC